jgi:hypothetical protein
VDNVDIFVPESTDLYFNGNTNASGNITVTQAQNIYVNNAQSSPHFRCSQTSQRMFVV